ncbi:bifunctional diaminohydroxyphosphoribosylaminopyrimidine deaminase/5-amino-6-(5-phosphoribosylamino)uracil reductase RibD [Terasakiella sp. A23]|uniref:bifunctional diaminohydroxyphosphoribosylaminopyrimidine deaminase/5-amino-6-(5-phosphoribosylamino)uracil reductase RibD n=1 Tax=Terasakiella sp. FCG-A23 TaxID=3080561 RepID=UPI0029552C54|nr:bifunctional diaminohydroxyphosphoribosylaminopyrimidine deaminase/5-amino-6-(5-phosphoribosylamino)uracil reductase RibD [Terasakiella sp. A23]MDV7338656.1 bifunctional diaminohydroxyphosphoribosylaminopyrimidine deaminase/5-amino-6-(5-phosphoribosylamino)uracil reductase RibD [Terasakiella sp. A23]
MSKIWEHIKNKAPTPSQDDAGFMKAALKLAKRGLGNVWPNPAVGCVIVKDNIVIGRGWTQPGGRPHAETEALGRAGDNARGSTAYVTLEPCSHYGKTPPCALALIEAGVTRVVVALEDPDPRVSGRGIKMLKEAGIKVVMNVCRDEALEVNEGFFLKVLKNRPMFTMKMATTLDGKIAVHTGESKWITEKPTREQGHLLRANHDAIMVGIGTASQDDPHLTCRLNGLEGHSPVRIVVDRRMRLPLTNHLVTHAHKIPTWMITLGDQDDIRAQAYQEAGMELITPSNVSDTDGGITLSWVAEELANRGLTRVLVEGGSHLAAAMLRRKLVDRLTWMRAPRMMGHDGIPAVQAFGVDHLEETPFFDRQGTYNSGDDLVEIYRRRDLDI